ncbi:MAG: NUDIX hydrolase [Deltaproteobacteria bacterium]|nr:NUDIX hydrolase [Deltaproteobacteria bacterium]
MSDEPLVVTGIEVVEDLTGRSRCDEGFLRVRRLRCRNRRADGSASAEYRVDVVDRPRLDAVAVLLYRTAAAGGRELLLRTNLRPAAYFRRDERPVVPDGREFLQVEEIVAGLLEPSDEGEAGIRARAAEEAWEEAGFRVDAARIQMLGAPFFVAPGILSERIHLCAADVTGLPQAPLPGDGSPLEEGAQTRWVPFGEALRLCRDGTVPDAKTELALLRLADAPG